MSKHMNKLSRRFRGLFHSRKQKKQRGYRRLRAESLESRTLLAADFLYSLSTNPFDSEDVNGDGQVSPVDALAVINALNDGGNVVQGEGQPGEKVKLQVDVSNDGALSPIDALLVINELNAEGEHGGAHQVAYTPITLDTTVAKGSRTNFFDYVDNGSNDQVNRSGGSWITDGFAQGDTILISDSGQFVDINVNLVLGQDENGDDVIGTGDADIRVHNNGIYTVQSVTATTITLDRDLITEFPPRSRLDGELVEGDMLFDNTASFFRVIDSVGLGGNFLVGTLVEDLRTVDDDGNALTSVRKGPFSAYVDVLFDSALAAPTGTSITDVSFFNGLNSQTFADLSTPGLLNEPGGVAFNNPGNAPTGGGLQLIFTTEFSAGNTAGTVMFGTNPADLSPNRDTLMFGSNFAIPVAEIDFQSASINIVAGPSEAPVVTGPNSVSTNEDTALTLSGFTITDVDSASINVTLSLTPNNGTLSQTTFNGTPAQVTTALNSITYTPLANSNTAVTLRISANDGGATPATKNVSITINPVNDPPVNAINGLGTPPAVAVANTGTHTFPSGTFQVTDVDAGNTLNVTISVQNGTLSSGGDTGTSLTFSGSSPVNIANVVYDPTDGFVGTDTLTITSTDGTATDTDTVALTVAPPQFPFAAGDTYTTTEGAGTITLNPSPLNNDLRDAGATLTAAPANGATTQGGSFTVNGSTFTYTPPADANFFGTDTFSYTIMQDAAHTPSTTGDTESTGTVTIIVQAVNDAPVNTVPGPRTVNEDTALSFTGASLISIQDIDAGAGNVTTTLTASNGTINVTGGAGVTNNGSKNVSVTGTVAQVNSILAGVTYTPDLNFNGSDQLTVSTNDNGNTGTGALTDVDTVNITISAINDAPTIAVPGPQTFFTDFDNRFTSTPNAFQISDVDAGNSNVQVDLTIGEGAVTLVNSTGVTVTQNPGGNNGIRITGSVTNINGALASGVNYRSSVDGDKTLSGTVNDLGNAGTGGPMTATATVDVEVLDFVPVDIVGQIFIDDDGDGQKDPDEAAIGGVDVTLSGTDFQGNAFSVTVTTDAEGNYLFEGVKPNLPGSPYTITREPSVFFQSSSSNQASLELDLIGNVTVTGGSLNFPQDGFAPEFADVWLLFALSEQEDSGILFGTQGSESFSIFTGPGWDVSRFSNARFAPGADGDSGVLTVFDAQAAQDRTAAVSTQTGTLTYRGTGASRVYRVIGGSELLGVANNGANPESEGDATTNGEVYARGVDSLFAGGGL
jgi:hypothetical protein